MYYIKAEHSFDSAHFLANYQGKCANLHGHRWRVEAEIGAEKLISEGPLQGMVLDFSDLKGDLRALLDFYDHALLIEKGTLRQQTMNCLNQEGFRVIELPFRPTAEQFAGFFYQCLKEKGHPVRRVTVYETPTNCASYEGGETP